MSLPPQVRIVVDPWLILETSGRAGTVGVAVGGEVAISRSLDGTKRHNRDLIPTCGELLAEAGFTAKQLAGVMVGIGPGSYTGLRVGLTTAKGFALATGCAFVTVPTYHTIAAQAPTDWPFVEVIGDALQGTIYRQLFGPMGVSGLRAPTGELEITNFEAWKSTLTPHVGVTGPGAEQFRATLHGYPLAATADCYPKATAVHRVGRTRPPLTRPEWFAVEPLYLRGSSAEEKAKQG